MNLLVLGSNGQLAQHLRKLLPTTTFWGRRECSLDDPNGVEKAILEAKPTVIVNAAAYTAVDRAEDEASAAWRINAEGAAAAARAAGALGIPLIHVSTDYVFDGESSRPYRDSDPTRPINVYGNTKLAGELAVASLCSQYWILRTSWVFSEFGGNFVTTMLRLANERSSLNVVNDQRGRPTYAGDLARAVSSLASGEARPTVPWGIHHLTGGAPVTWHQFAQRVIARAHALDIIVSPPRIEAIATAEYPARARRPSNSVLEPSPALHRALGFQPDWQAGLEEVLARVRFPGR